MFYVLLLTACILGAGYYRWTMRRIYHLSRQIKCDVPTLPLIGHTHHFIGDQTAKMNTIKLFGREAINQGGMTHCSIGPRYLIVLADVPDLEALMKVCLEKDDLMSFLKLGVGEGLIFASMSSWHPRRKILAPTFSQKNLNTFVSVFAKQNSVMVSLLKQAPKGSFSLWDYVTTYAMDSVCETTLGVKLNSQKYPKQPFLDAFTKGSQLAVDRLCSPWLHPLAIYKLTPQYASLMKYKAMGSVFVDQIIKTKRQELMKSSLEETCSGTKENPKTFLDYLIETEAGFNDLELREELLVLILAGTDTLAVSIAYTVVMLSRHQDVQEKVHQEILEIIGDTDRPIVAQDLPRLKYLDAVIRESLRLHPPAPIITRKVQNDVLLPSGVTLVPGCGILVHIWAANRNPAYWGPDADEFRPERFFEKNNTRALLTFSSGPRNCVGLQFAMMSIKTSIASIVRQFRVLPAAEDIVHDGLNTKYRPIQESYEIMMKDVNKFLVRLEGRN